MSVPALQLTPRVQELDARIRGRLIYQVLRRWEVDPDGSFIFAGWLITYVSDGDAVIIGLQEYFR
ncbi:hypothetical protein [Bradyrhizobium sp. ORS 285]|uniref:hypothetical protein n=1 Tax=Bradyrhizobium sp. ORS 285 TaxID=115808 RepID=UPI000553F345|nr:hypothetical protein [Bradyrhizobium sp. ORS 285]